MKRTPEDDSFAAEFGRQLRHKYSAAKREGTTDQSFANSIGVERAQLDKYLRGESMPSVRTVALAYRKYEISTDYDKIPVNRSLSRRKRSAKVREHQLLLPFTIVAEGTEQIGVKFGPSSTRHFELRLTLRDKVR